MTKPKSPLFSVIKNIGLYLAISLTESRFDNFLVSGCFVEIENKAI